MAGGVPMSYVGLGTCRPELTTCGVSTRVLLRKQIFLLLFPLSLQATENNGRGNSIHLEPGPPVLWCCLHRWAWDDYSATLLHNRLNGARGSAFFGKISYLLSFFFYGACPGANKARVQLPVTVLFCFYHRYPSRNTQRSCATGSELFACISVDRSELKEKKNAQRKERKTRRQRSGGPSQSSALPPSNLSQTRDFCRPLWAGRRRRRGQNNASSLRGSASLAALGLEGGATQCCPCTVLIFNGCGYWCGLSD